MLHICLRTGSADTSRGMLRFCDELIARVDRAGATGENQLRADSRFWACQTFDRLDRVGRHFSIGVRFRDLRDLTRYCKAQIRDRQREANRLHKVMQDTGVKLDSVASDLLGVSGRAMLDALVAGTTDPELLANWRAASCARSCPRSGRRWEAA